MIQSLPLSGLRAFEAAARTRSFRAAAEMLGVTPSAVSHAIRALEYLLQTSLFFRDGRKVGLTTSGEILFGHVQHGFDELQRGIAAVLGLRGMLLRLHSAPSFAAQWLVPRLPNLLAAKPGLEVRIAASVNYSRFLTYEYDVEIVYGAPTAERYAVSRHPSLVVLPLGEEVVTPLGSPSVAARIAGARDLPGMSLIESDNKQVRWPAWFAANGLECPDLCGPRFDRSFLSISAAADGLGIALESTALPSGNLLPAAWCRPCQEGTTQKYVGHFLSFPRAEHYREELRVLINWMAAELGITLDVPGPASPRSTPMVSRG